MAITDQQILSEIQAAMVEPTIDGGVTWTSGMWTAAEVLAYLNQRQDRFLKESEILISWTTMSSPAGQLKLTMPTDWVSSQRTSFRRLTDTTFTPVPIADTWQADHGVPTWPIVTADRPQVAMDSVMQTLTLELAPAPTTDGVISLYYVSIGDQFDGTGVLFTVPDEFVPFIKWGVIADMLNKAGRANDPERATYCQMRFDEGVTLAKSWIDGFR